MINRRNILELIGRHRGKYHSCIMTCYSLDFAFFEERVLPTLRQANVKNVNLLADGHYLELSQEATTGKEFKHNKTYNFQPVYQKGVFHPKIMLLSGVRHGLLVIGSGNITSSGLSTNDEIWGAFHLDNLGNENASLFGAVWSYLQPYLEKSLGFVSQKIDWMQQQSPWLKELPVTDKWIYLKSLETEIKFIGNRSKTSTFSQLVSNVPNQEIAEMTVVSPYYDKSGAQLNQLKEHFSPNVINCIVDSNSGLNPYDMDNDKASQIRFYDWVDCKEDYNERFNRLHAKLVHFRNSREEYMLLGSANVTLAAMGKENSTAANAEAGILLRRPIKEKNWIQELKIKFPQATIELSKSRNAGLGEGSARRNNYVYRVLYSELRADEITVYLNKSCNDPIDVGVLNRSDVTVESNLKKAEENILILQVMNPDEAFKLFVSNNNDRISNYSLIHRLEALLRCNPDPDQEKLDAMLEYDFPNGEGLTDLLSFVDYNWADDESSSITKVFHHNPATALKGPNQEKGKEYEVLDQDVFNKVSKESLLKQSGELSNPTVKIAEFLGLFVSGVYSIDDEFKESEEQKLFEDEQQQGEGGEAGNNSQRRSYGQKEKLALKKYFKKLNEIYTKELDKFYRTGITADTPSTPITIRSLSGILIALHLIQLKYGKKFTVQTKDIDASGDLITKEEAYIVAGGFDDSLETVKGFLLNVFGKYLLLSSAGPKHYDYEILNQKLGRSQFQLLVKSLSLVLNVPWREPEMLDRDVLILNCMYYTIGDQILLENKSEEIITKLEDYRATNGFITPGFEEQLSDLKKRVFPDYIDWLGKFTNTNGKRKNLIFSTMNLRHGDIIFNSRIGFNIITEVLPDGNRNRLNLIRPGYPYEDGEFELTRVQFGTKSILYE